MNNFLQFLDRIFDRLYGSRWNPLQYSGALALFFLLVCTVSGVVLLFFFRISEPYESVHQLQQSGILLKGLRSAHRYTSDLALALVLFHMFRMWVEKRYWGPRALAWISGCLLLGMLMVVGWTGFILVWDQQALALTRIAAQIFGVERVVSGASPPGGSFFFLNLFFHMSVPLLMVGGFLVHVSKMRKPILFLPTKLWVSLLFVIIAVALMLPTPLGKKADFLTIDQNDPVNHLYGFPVFFADKFGATATVAIIGIIFVFLIFVPFLLPRTPFRRSPVCRPPNSWLSLSGIITTAILLGGLTQIAQGMYETRHDNAVLRLSLRIPRRQQSVCKTMDAPNNDKIPFHMRPMNQCQAQNRFELKLFKGGTLIWQSLLSKTSDRPYIIEKEFPLSPGDHHLKASLRALDDDTSQPVEIEFQSQLAKGQVGLLSFDATRFVFNYAESK